MCSITASVWVHKYKLSYWEWSAAALELSLLSDSFPLKHILFGCRSCSPAPLSTKSSEHTVIFHYQHCILVFLMISEHDKLSNVWIQAPCAHSHVKQTDRGFCVWAHRKHTYPESTSFSAPHHVCGTAGAPTHSILLHSFFITRQLSSFLVDFLYL